MTRTINKRNVVLLTLFVILAGVFGGVMSAVFDEEVLPLTVLLSFFGGFTMATVFPPIDYDL